MWSFLYNLVRDFAFHIFSKESAQLQIELIGPNENEEIGKKRSPSTDNPQYLVIINKSSIEASRVRFNALLSFDDKKHTIEKEIPPLRPGEYVKVLIRLGDLRDKYPDLFQQVTEDDKAFYNIPKKTLYIDLKVTVKWNWRKKLEDSYRIEWGSLKRYPRLTDHPVKIALNKRGDVCIYKLGL